MDNKLTLGEKIKKFRKRAGLSQFKLEILIDAAPGSISRIENGEVNPSKETLLKIIQKLDLNAYDATSLFDIDMNKLSNLVNVAKKLNTLDFDKLIQDAVNELVAEFKFLGAVITLVKGDDLYAYTLTQTWYTNLIEKIAEMPLNIMHASLIRDKDNISIRTVNEGKTLYFYRMGEVAVPVLPETIANIIERLIKLKSGVSIPMVGEGKVIGTLMILSNQTDELKYLTPLLETFADYLAVSIVNARKYRELQESMKSVRNLR